MESLYPNEYISASVLSSWSCILNSEEVSMDEKSSSRLFCPVNMFGENNILESTQGKQKVLDSFMKNLKSTLTSSVFGSLNNVNLLFIPILYEKHYFVICFNFIEDKIFVMDNMKASLSAEKKAMIRAMIDIVKHYLKMEEAGLFEKMEKVEFEVLDMPWRTDKNFADCGVFAMRHMETYNGEFKDVLSYEGEEQLKELKDLRYKYLAKILLADVNELKKKVIEEVKEYEEMDTVKKKEFKATAATRIGKRLAEFLNTVI